MPMLNDIFDNNGKNKRKMNDIEEDAHSSKKIKDNFVPCHSPQTEIESKETTSTEENSPNTPLIDENGTSLINFGNRLKKILLIDELDDLLKQRISLEDFKKTIRSVINAVRNSKEDLLSLKPGEAYFCKKDKNILRDIQILKTFNNKYKLILETKKYDIDNNKTLTKESFLGKGTFKEVTLAFRVDSDKGIKPCASARVRTGRLDHQNQMVFDAGIIDETLKEVKLMSTINHPNILHYDIGEAYSSRETGNFFKKYKIEEKRIRLYSKCALGNLSDVLYEKNFFEKNPLTENDKKELMLQIFKAVAHLHDLEIIHQDLKPDNIFIYRNKEGQYHAKIGDFGLAVTKNQGKNSMPLATYFYESPEISMQHANKNSPYCKYFFASQNQKSLAHEIIHTERKRLQNKHLYTTPHYSNDNWALGMIYCNLMYRGMPTKKYIEQSNDMILKGLLCPDREKRLSCEQAQLMFTNKEKEVNRLECF